MGGRLIRKSGYPGDPKSVAYIVAIEDATEAIELIKNKAPTSGGDVDDLGHVSDALVRALHLIAGEFIFIPVDIKLSDTSESEDEKHRRVLGE
jgi:hypothetical protein